MWIWYLFAFWFGYAGYVLASNPVVDAAVRETGEFHPPLKKTKILPDGSVLVEHLVGPKAGTSEVQWPYSPPPGQ